MPEPKVTPGDWGVWQLAPDSDPEHPDKPRQIIVAGEDGDVEVCSYIHNPADAPILGASKSLLEAVREVRKWFGKVDYMSTSPYGKEVARIARLMDNAIKKAEGK